MEAIGLQTRRYTLKENAVGTIHMGIELFHQVNKRKNSDYSGMVRSEQKWRRVALYYRMRSSLPNGYVAQNASDLSVTQGLLKYVIQNLAV